MSDQEICGVVVVRPASSFRSSTGRPRRCPYENHSRRAGNRNDARMRHTKLTLPGFRQQMTLALPKYSFVPLKSQSLTNSFSDQPIGMSRAHPSSNVSKESKQEVLGGLQ